MPKMRKPSTFGKVGKMAEGLLGEVPIAGGMGHIPGTADGKVGLSSLFRTLKTPIAAAPQTMQKIDAAFEAYLQRIAELLLEKK